MGWIFWALVAAVLNGVVDFMFKLSSGKINSALGGIILNLVGIVPLVAFFVYIYLNKQAVVVTKQGFAFMAIAGVCVGMITIALFKMFSTGQNISVATPVMRISGIVFASLLGVIILHEPISLKYIVGFALSILGLFLITTA